MENFKIKLNVLADNTLLRLLDSDPGTPFTKEALQTVLNVLDKVSLPCSLDYGILTKLYDRLRNWSSFADISLVLPRLSTVYDHLIHRDLGHIEVSNSLCELLFLIEDLADHQHCKVAAGEYFIQRMLALAGSKVTGIRLQRTAVETLSSIIFLCPSNQKLILENFTSEWKNLVKKVLPTCGDFLVQASIIEILYRLSKGNSECLDYLDDKTLREKMVSLHHEKKIDLLKETRSFLNHMNHSLGRSRSVYSCLAEDIILDGRSTPLKDEKWVHFGTDHISCYAVLDSDAGEIIGKVKENVSLLDVFYSSISDVQVCSDQCVEFVFRELPSQGQDVWIRTKANKLKIIMKPREIESMRGYVFTRINTKPKDLSKGGSNGENSENTSTTPSFSANVARSFRKASIGFAIPLPRKFKLPKFPSNVDQKIDTKNNGSRQLDYEARSLEVKVEVQPSGKEQSSHVSRETVSINKRVPHHQTATLSTQAFCLFDNKIQENVSSSVHCNPEEHTSSKEDVKILDPKKDTESSVRPVDNINVSMPQISHLHTDDIPRQGRRESVANCKANTCPNKADIDLPNLSSRKSRADSGIAKKTSCIEKDLATSGLEQDTVRNVRTHDTTNALLEVAQEDNISNGKMSDIEEDTGHKHGDSGGRKTAHLQEKILEVLNDRDLRGPIDERNQKNSTSDPIETDSEQKRPTTDNRSAKIKSKHNFKRTSLYEFDRRELAPRYRRRNHLQCGALIKNNPPQKDVFAFDEHEQSLIGQQFNLVVESEQKHRKPDKSKDDNHLAANCESPLVHKQCTIDEDHEKEHKEFAKSEDDHRIAENGSPPAVIYRYSPAAKDTALKENDCKTRDCIHDDHQFDTTAISMNLRNAETPPLEKVCLFQNTQQARKRKRRLVENNIANDIKQSPERMIPPVNDGLPFLKEMPAFFTNMESPIPDIDYTIKANSDSENVVKTLRIEGSRRSRRRNREFGQTRKIVLNLHTPPLNEDLRPTDPVDTESVIDGEMQLLAELVQKTMTKIKSKASTKSCQILASAMDAVQQRCQEVQEQIQADLDQCTKTSQKTFEQLQLQLEEQHEAFTSMQTKWRSELNESLNRLKEISLQVEISQNLLKSVSDKYKNSHRRLFSKMGEFVDTHLCETEQKLIALRKRSKCIRTELRDALLKIF